MSGTYKPVCSALSSSACRTWSSAAVILQELHFSSPVFYYKKVTYFYVLANLWTWNFSFFFFRLHVSFRPGEGSWYDRPPFASMSIDRPPDRSDAVRLSCSIPTARPVCFQGGFLIICSMFCQRIFELFVICRNPALLPGALCVALCVLRGIRVSGTGRCISMVFSLFYLAMYSLMARFLPPNFLHVRLFFVILSYPSPGKLLIFQVYCTVYGV